MVRVDHLSYNFGSSWALKDVGFELDKGDFMFLIGRSGAGKTTLLRVLHGALPVQRGRARVAGIELSGVKTRSIYRLRRRVGVVFQDFKILMNRTAFDNVILALDVCGMPRTQGERRVRAVLRSMGLAEKMNTVCREMAGGEQQRVAIARAMVVGPQVLLADEPTGNLDLDLSLHLLKVFKQFQKHGTTVILATHNRELLRAMPEAKILQLKQGQIAGANFAIPGSAAQ